MKILFAHSDRDFLVSFAELLSDDGFEVTTVFDGPSAIFRIYETRFDAAVIDSRLPRLTTGEVLGVMRDADVPTVVTVDTRIDRRLLASRELAGDYIAFPFTADELSARIRRVVGMKRDGKPVPCGKAQLDVSRFSLGGVLLTASEIALLTQLSTGRTLRTESVYADSLGEKLIASGSGQRIIYATGEGYKLVSGDE